VPSSAQAKPQGCGFSERSRRGGSRQEVCDRNGGGVEGADRKSARETPSPAPAILLSLYVI